RGVHVRRGAPGAVERRRDDTGRKLLAARDQVIGSARRQLAQDAQARGEGLDLRERVLDRLDELVRARTGTEQGTDGPEMLGAERLYGRAGAVRAALDRRGGEIEQRVRDAGHRRYHDDDGRGPACPDDGHRLRDGGTVRERGTAELVDLDGARGARHGRSGNLCLGPAKTERPGNGSRGRSLFSTLFNVAAIRGKSPRGVDCMFILTRRLGDRQGAKGRT